MQNTPRQPGTRAHALATERRQQRIRQAAYNRQRGLMMVMDGVQDPHNLAAIARTCDSFGVQNVAFTSSTLPPFDPKYAGKKSSASAGKWLDYRFFAAGTRACLTTLQAEGWHVVATVANPDAPSLYAVDWTQYRQLAVLVGSEKLGISEEGLALADTTVTIPMRGMVSSLNVSVAAAIILSEITRQREASENDFRLPPNDAEALFHRLLLR